MEARPPADYAVRRSRREDRKLLLALGVYGAFTLSFIALWFVGTFPFAWVVALSTSSLLLSRPVRRQIDVAFGWRVGSVWERRVGEELERLPHGYEVRHDIAQPGEGNIDHVVRGPAGVFLVETKSHRYQPEHLVKVKRQSAKLSTEVGGVFVTPVICVAARTYGPRHTQGVWVMGMKQLVPWLLSRPSRSTGAASVTR
jgi:hypothetical protein